MLNPWNRLSDLMAVRSKQRKVYTKLICCIFEQNYV